MEEITDQQLDNNQEEEDHKLDLLQFVHDTHRREMSFHRDVMNRVFQWTSGVFIAMAGGLVVIEPTVGTSRGIVIRLFVTAAVVLITTFSVRLLKHSADAIDTNAHMVVKTDILMHLFDPGYFGDDESLYPEKWLRWGTEKGAGYYEVYNTIIVILLAVAMIGLAWTL